MHKTQEEAAEFWQDFKSKVDNTAEGREAVLCVPFTDLGMMNKSLHGSRVRLGAQNIHWEDSGAYTNSASLSQHLAVSTLADRLSNVYQ